MAFKIISQVEFINYLSALPAEGETLLLVQQKEVMKDGQPVLHGDGTIKYTWLPSLPTKIKPHSALYVNTGSFIINRFDNGKLSASAANCEHVLFLMLDDIGTKSKIPPLEPTWKIETSPGNQQWGYIFDLDSQPTKGEFIAAITAIAAAGYTDGGATNAVRNVRVPGSINYKPGKDNFEAKLLEFHEEREFTLDQICEALGVNPKEADTASIQRIALADDGDDDILQWISDNAMLLEKANGSGWYGIVCPNEAAHSDGNPMARYHPVNRAFCCYHEHCQDFDSHAYLDWAATNGAPRHTPGVRSELLTDRMAKALQKLEPTEAFKDATERLKEIERKELARVDQADWYDRFAYILSDDSYFDLLARNDLSRGAFNALYRHVSCMSNHTKRKIEASNCFDENRVAHNAKALRGLTYAAGEGVLVGHLGDLYGNRWVDARPKVSSKGGNIDRWLDHCRHLIPNQNELNHVWDIMAFKLQNPKTKINHAVLHVGEEGSGKDLMWKPFIWSICGDYLKNLSVVDGDRIQSQFNDHLESEILILNELKEPDSAARRDLANKLKPIIAAPPEMFSVNPKGKKRYDVANRLFVLAFSNEQVPISLSSQDRRWFCISSDAAPMEQIKPGSGAELVKWYEAGNLELIANWLWARDVSKFNPGAAPEMTEFKQNLLESGMSGLESSIIEMIRNKQGDFGRGVIGSPLHPVCDRIADMLNLPRNKVPQSALLHAMKEAGWKDMGRLASAELPNKKRVFASKEAAKEFNKSDLRRMIELPPEPKAVVLDIKRSA
jgi:hypothetical protein